MGSVKNRMSPAMRRILKKQERQLMSLAKVLLAPTPTMQEMERTAKSLAAVMHTPKGQAIIEKHLKEMETLQDAKPTDTEASQTLFNGERCATGTRHARKAPPRTCSRSGRS